jgi:Tfp pilus assembly protein PilF
MAYARDPDNADYLFNVAVSLDHLRQNKLAAQYYRMALNARRNAAQRLRSECGREASP